MNQIVDQLTGSRMQGEIRLAEGGINQLLSVTSRGAPTPHVTVLDDSRVLLRYGVLQVSAQLSAVADTHGSVRVTLSLSSVMVAWALRAAFRQPFIRIEGRQVTIDVAAVPALPRGVISGGTSDPWPYRHRPVSSCCTSTSQSRREMQMDEWLQSQLAAGLPALRGSRLSGTLTVKQDLLNDLLSRWLAAQAQNGKEQTAQLPPNTLLPFLKHAAIRAERGTVLLDFQIRI